MKILKGNKFRLEPKRREKHLFAQFAGCNRFVWNKALALQLKRKDEGEKFLPYSKLCLELPKWKKDVDTSFLKDCHSQTLQQTLKCLDKAIWEALDKKNPKRFPRFKKKGVSDSFRYPQGFKVDERSSRVYLPKIGWVRYRKTKKLKGEVRNITISRRGEHWFVSIQTEEEVEDRKHQSKTIVGIDLGVKVFAACSDGVTHLPNNPLRVMERKLKRAQRSLSRKKTGSANFKKQKRKVLRLHQGVANARNDYLHKLSTDISKNHAIVVLEDLRVQNMSASAKGTVEEPGRNVKAKSGLNRAILDQGWFEFRRQLEYKQSWRGGEVVCVPARNTSRSCPECGHVAAENRRTQSDFSCVSCGYSKNADLNAATNILAAGHAALACGDALNRDSVKQEPSRKEAA